MDRDADAFEGTLTWMRALSSSRIDAGFEPVVMVDCTIAIATPWSR